MCGICRADGEFPVLGLGRALTNPPNDLSIGVFDPPGVGPYLELAGAPEVVASAAHKHCLGAQNVFRRSLRSSFCSFGVRSCDLE